MYEQDLNVLSAKQIYQLRRNVMVNLKWCGILSTYDKRIAFYRKNKELLKKIEDLRTEKKKESLKIFYSLPKETRGKKWHIYIKYNGDK